MSFEGSSLRSMADATLPQQNSDPLERVQAGYQAPPSAALTPVAVTPRQLPAAPLRQGLVVRTMKGAAVTVMRMDNVGIVVNSLDEAMSLDLSARWCSTRTPIASATSAIRKASSSGLPRSLGKEARQTVVVTRCRIAGTRSNKELRLTGQAVRSVALALHL
jgi:hypothetical protein